LADELAVDVGAVAAAEVADAYVGRVDLDQAMVPRDEAVTFLGTPRLAVVGAPEQQHGRLRVHGRLARLRACGISERDLGTGGVRVARVRSGREARQEGSEVAGLLQAKAGRHAAALRILGPAEGFPDPFGDLLQTAGHALLRLGRLLAGDLAD